MRGKKPRMQMLLTVACCKMYARMLLLQYFEFPVHSSNTQWVPLTSTVQNSTNENQMGHCSVNRCTIIISNAC